VIFTAKVASNDVSMHPAVERMDSRPHFERKPGVNQVVIRTLPFQKLASSSKAD
jgi:hypothetical protein